MNNLTIELCERKNKCIINNLYPLYLHDLAEIRNVLPNKYGVFEDDEKYNNWSGYYAY
ncbi:hypothetical protein J2736_002982 [Paenibacillus qinlingensis]|uniref:Uncharacterized protein n=1 Tax=Paenibacillus qinlingensis TaxID=1837343 RepID=A0ABU1NWD7_9BACL|nr:hypothetical protein [Paenibacillus qinlingensis]